MLNRTQPNAGIIGNRRASPLLSPSAKSAICCAANAASVVVNVANIVAATAEVVAVENENSDGFWVEREMDLGRASLGADLLMLKHLALRIDMEAMVAAIINC